MADVAKSGKDDAPSAVPSSSSSSPAPAPEKEEQAACRRRRRRKPKAITATSKSDDEAKACAIYVESGFVPAISRNLRKGAKPAAYAARIARAGEGKFAEPLVEGHTVVPLSEVIKVHAEVLHTPVRRRGSHLRNFMTVVVSRCSDGYVRVCPSGRGTRASHQSPRRGGRGSHGRGQAYRS